MKWLYAEILQVMPGEPIHLVKEIYAELTLPEGLHENDYFREPIITPSTKASEGHDEDISKEEIIKRNIVSKDDYEILEQYALQLFARGKELAAQRGLILVDTKYEFGKIER